MPLYELSLILRPMPKPEIVRCLKRVAEHIWKENGVLQKIEYLGHQNLPYAIKSTNDDEKFHEGLYFLYHCSIRQSKLITIKPELKLDLDILKSRFNWQSTADELKDYECTLSEELLPPGLRKSVRPLLEDKNVRADVRR